jgi:macrophage erythroblast attacher
MTSLDYSFIRTPHDATSRVCRNTQKIVDKEVTSVVSQLGKLQKKGKRKATVSQSSVIKTLKSLITKLKSVKRKVQDAASQSDRYVHRTRLRLDMLEEYVLLRSGGKDFGQTIDYKDEPMTSTATSTVTVPAPVPAPTTAGRMAAPIPTAAAVCGSSDCDMATPTTTTHSQMAGAAIVARMTEKQREQQLVMRQKQRLNRIVADYLLRQGLYESAKAFVEATGIKDHVDMEVFANAKFVLTALDARDCQKALQWCAANRSRLNRLNSPLEFQLRMQEYIEILRNGKSNDAIAYSREHLVTFTDTHQTQVQEAMCALLFAGTAESDATTADASSSSSAPASSEPLNWGPYSHLLSEDRWKNLREQFLSDLYTMSSMPHTSLLDITLHAGITALKTPSCDSKGHYNASCPVCSSRMHSLASSVRMSHRVHSRIVCKLSGDVMDETNPPLVLPNGNVYSTNALRKFAKEHDGTVTCPRTHESFPLTDCQRVYVM